MNVEFREARQSDIPFLRQMLYEAVFWGAGDDKPPFEEGLEYPGVSNALAGWGERDGDIAVVAEIDFKQIGAAWIRYWTDDNNIRGYYDENIPVLVIGVSQDYRHQGIGGKMISWLVDYAGMQGIARISLMVSKDNYAINLYGQCGFVEYADKGNSVIMVREIDA